MFGGAGFPCPGLGPALMIRAWRICARQRGTPRGRLRALRALAAHHRLGLLFAAVLAKTAVQGALQGIIYTAGGTGDVFSGRGGHPTDFDILSAHPGRGILFNPKLPFMKKLLFLLLLTLPAPAQDFVRVKMTKLHRVTLSRGCVIDATYPQVPGRSDLNAKLRELLPADCKAEDVEPGTVRHIEQEFKVTYNGKGLLSVFGDGLSMSTRNGHPNEAHPSKLFGGVILDIKTGKAYSLRDLFGRDAYAKLDPLITKGAAKAAGSSEIMPLTDHTYHCYLSAKGVTFYQIFDNFAAGSIEVTIPYAEAVPLADPAGPLMRFKK